MKEFFESEMQHFTASAKEFAQAYPEQAAFLNIESQTDRDPYVERLFEGMAFLTAGLRKRLHQGVPELAGQLLQQMAPVLGRTYPSSCIVELMPPDSLPTAIKLRKGQKITARNLGPDQIACHFTSIRDEYIRPLKIIDVQQVQNRTDSCQLNIRFEKTGTQSWRDLSLDRLPVYISGDRSLTYRLWQLLTHAENDCYVYQEDHSNSFPVRFVPQQLFRMTSMLPESGRDVAACSLALDYFCGRDYFFYVDLQGLQQANWNNDINHFTLHLASHVRLPVNHTLNGDHLVLNTVPVVNLFSAEAEPIRFDHTRAEYLVQPDTRYLGNMEIFSVDRVAGRNLYTGTERQYVPLYAQHYLCPQDSIFYTLHDTKPSGEPVTRMVLKQATEPVAEVVSITVTASNGHYPRRYLGIGELQEIRCDICPGIKARNITRPTQPRRPLPIHSLEWRWVAALATSINHLGNKDQLQQLLGLFDWSEEPANRKRIESILSFNKELQHRIHRGALYRQWMIELRLQSKGFDSEGDAELFAFMLHQLLAALAPVGDLVQTSAMLLPEYKEVIWKPLL